MIIEQLMKSASQGQAASRQDCGCLPPQPMRPAISLSIVTPTYNERSNIRSLVQAIAAALGEERWELIVVDDDSPDQTYDEVVACAQEGWPVRCIRRIGRRGLASAVVEGALSCHSEFIAVIDADMQHDEALLPRMLEVLRTTDTDLVIGSRYIQGGGLGEWNAMRRRMSSFATWCSTALVGTVVSDPMSGFFMMRRNVFMASCYDLSQQGYKILLDIMASSPDRLKIVELPYIFRNRVSGESKMDVSVLTEFLFLLVEKLTRGYIPPRFVLFCFVGGLGLGMHLVVLQAMGRMGFDFMSAQIGATIAAMTLNFLLNNSITYSNRRLKGWRLISGYVLFCVVCSMGMIANIGVAKLAISEAASWPVAGIAGALMSAVFNFGLASQFVWTTRRPRRSKPVLTS